MSATSSSSSCNKPKSQQQPGPPPPPPPPGGRRGGSGGGGGPPPPPPPPSGPPPPPPPPPPGGPPPPPRRPPGGGGAPPPPPPPPSHHHQQQHQQHYTPKMVPKAYDEEKTSLLPSCVKDGISLEEEKIKRSKTCRFIEEAGRILKLPRVAIATGMVFFHRFYAKHSFAEHDRFEVAVACILLAAKTEESPKKLTTVIIECHRLKNRGAAAARQRQLSGGGNKSPTPPHDGGAGMVVEILDSKSDEYLKLKDRILLLERVVLHTIAFELSIDHPYKFLVDQIRKMHQLRQIEYLDRSKQLQHSSSSSSSTTKLMINELVQYAMNFANDSMHTCLCLQYRARTIALACVYMSAKFCHIKPTENRSWTDILGVRVDELAHIAEQIMELISNKKGNDSISSFKVIKADLEKLKKKQKSIIMDGTSPGKRGVNSTSTSSKTPTKTTTTSSSGSGGTSSTKHNKSPLSAPSSSSGGGGGGGHHSQQQRDGKRQRMM